MVFFFKIEYLLNYRDKKKKCKTNFNGLKSTLKLYKQKFYIFFKPPPVNFLFKIKNFNFLNLKLIFFQIQLCVIKLFYEISFSKINYKRSRIYAHPC